MIEDLKLFMDVKRKEFEEAREDSLAEMHYYTGAISTLDDLSEKFFPKALEEELKKECSTECECSGSNC